MRAMVCDAPHRPLRAAETPRPEPGPGELLLAVQACGVCRTDLHILDGDLPDAKRPLILGHEIVARVAAAGPGVARFAAGQRVGGPWPGWAWRGCRYFRTGRQHPCHPPRLQGAHLDRR